MRSLGGINSEYGMLCLPWIKYSNMDLGDCKYNEQGL